MCLARMWIYTYLISIGIFHDGSAIHFGQLAEKGQFKYMARLTLFDGFQCSGVIIDHYHILTTTLCVIDLRPEDLIVTVGTVNLDSDFGIDRVVQKIHIYPDFKQSMVKQFRRYVSKKLQCGLMQFFKLRGEKRINHGIAVVTLTRSLPLGEKITSLSLPRISKIPERIPLIFSGWSRSGCDSVGIHVRHTKMYFHTPPRDELTLPAIKNGFYAVNTINDRSFTSYEDIGSPLVIGDILYGILIPKIYCGNRHVSAFLKVHHYRDFIEKAMSDTKSLVQN